MLFNLSRFNRFLALIAIGFVVFLNAEGSRALAAPPTESPVGPVGYVRAGQLNIRSGPGQSYGVITTVYRNDTLGLTGHTVDNTWLRVRLPLTGQEGWAAARFVEIGLGSIYDLPVIDGENPSPPTSPATIYVTARRLNVRGGPGLNYNIINSLQRGDTRPLIGRNRDGSWLQIQQPDTLPTFAEPTGWVLARYVRSSVPIHTLPVTDGSSPPPVTEPIGVVIPHQLNMRSGPGLNYPIVGRVYVGQQVQLLGRTGSGDWLKVDLLGGYGGWVMARYVESFVPIDGLPILNEQPVASRIRFEPGGTSANVAGALVVNGMDSYVLTALAGQTMTVKVESGAANVLLSIHGADGQVLKSSGAGSANWSGLLPATQDYFITISAASGLVVNYTLSVFIPPL